MRITLLDRASLGEDTPIEILKELGEVEVYESTVYDQILPRIEKTDVIIINKVKIDRYILENANQLKLICVFATGYDNIDVVAARERGIAVCNVPGYSTESVTQYTITTVLALYSHLSEYNEYVRSGEYTKSGVPNLLSPVFNEVCGKTWGIIGYGNIGKRVAEVANALGAKVIVNKRNPGTDPMYVDIDTLCKNSDIITIHCPLNNDSRGLISKEKIALMKKSVVIVNEARGAVVNESEIADAIEKGRIAAFGCDVYSTEPFAKEHPFSKIMNRKNVLLTPHSAWGAYEARERCLKIICDNIRSFYEGKLYNRVD